MKCLAALLLHNDLDLIHDQLEHLRSNMFDIIVYDHDSTDGSKDMLNQYIGFVKDVKHIPPSVTFYENRVFEYVSRDLFQYKHQYDWFLFIESDEFLEGPDRSKSLYCHLLDVLDTDSECINFENYAYWYTDKDIPDIISPVRRVKYYSFRPSPQKIYVWRPHLDSIRWYNHNPVGKVHPVDFKTRHYEYRSRELLVKKLDDRISRWITDPNRGFTNWHYEHMKDKILKFGIQSFDIPSEELHYDDGRDLIKDTKHDFSHIYTDDEMLRAYDQKYNPNH